MTGIADFIFKIIDSKGSNYKAMLFLILVICQALFITYIVYM